MLTIPFILLVLATFVSLASLICHVALPFVLRSLQIVSPGLRSHLILLVAAAPWLIGASLLVSSVADIIFGACDFGTTCLWNEDPRQIEPTRAIIAVPLVLSTSIFVVGYLRQKWLERRILATLESASISTDEPQIRIVPHNAVIAFAGRGRIYISQAIREKLQPEQYRAVILHEQAHLQRRDGFFQIVANFFAASYLPPFRKRILNALALANEQACDEEAAYSVGHTIVASAILAVARMSGTRTISPLRTGFAESFVAARVRFLLNRERPKGNARLLRTASVLIIISAFLTGDVLYYVAMMILYPFAE